MQRPPSLPEACVTRWFSCGTNPALCCRQRIVTTSRPRAIGPYDEINVIHEGGHYGWPYCYDTDQSTPAWTGSAAMDCRSSDHVKPVAFLPPHAAPLGAIYYGGAMFPALKGKLLMSWHGYRPSGSRLVSFDVDAKGVPVAVAHARFPEYTNAGVTWKDYRPGPAAEPTILTPGWSLVPGAASGGGSGGYQRRPRWGNLGGR